MTRSRRTLQRFKRSEKRRMQRSIGLLTVAAIAAGVIMAGCAGGPAAMQLHQEPPTLAVWPLENLSLPGAGNPDIGDLLTSKVMEAAESTGRFVLVERERLLSLLRELSLGSSELADENTALRIGRLSGARMMLFGVYQVVAGQMRIDLRLVSVETGRVVSTAAETVPEKNLAAWLQGAADASRSLLSPPET